MPLLDVETRARGLKLAVDAIKAGGVVLAVIDGPGGTSSTTVRCVGRAIVLRRGPLVLARLTNARIVPVVAQWTSDGTIRIVVGQPLRLPPAEDPGFEPAAASAVAAWLEQHVAAHPADLWPYTLRNLLTSPVLSPLDRATTGPGSRGGVSG